MTAPVPPPQSVSPPNLCSHRQTPPNDGAHAARLFRQSRMTNHPWKICSTPALSGWHPPKVRTVVDGGANPARAERRRPSKASRDRVNKSGMHPLRASTRAAVLAEHRGQDRAPLITATMTGGCMKLRPAKIHSALTPVPPPVCLTITQPLAQFWAQKPAICSECLPARSHIE